MKTALAALLIIVLAFFILKHGTMTARQSLLKLVYPLLMLKQKLFPAASAVLLNKGNRTPPHSFYDLEAVANDGSVLYFRSFAGKKVLIVNTASDCGFTAQFNELEKLHRESGDQLVVLGFPANDFKEQEKKDDQAIAAFCKLNYGVTFQLMRKSIVVKAGGQNPVFSWLSHSEANGWCDKAPEWNFSKYLVDRQGNLAGYFAPTVSPLSQPVRDAVK